MTEPAAPAHSLENVWLVQATYAPDAAETRVPLRARHLARIATLKAAGTIIEAGAFLDMSGSLLMVRAEDEAAAIDIARQDIYMQNGVWVELRAKPFGRVALDRGGAGSRSGSGQPRAERSAPHPPPPRPQPDDRGESLALGRPVRSARSSVGELAPDRGLGHHATGSRRVALRAPRPREGPARWRPPGRPPRPRRRVSWRRAWACTLVASTTGEEPVCAAAADRAAWSAANAAPVAAWSAGSPETRSRNASDESTSTGRSAARRTWTCRLPPLPRARPGTDRAGR